MKEVNIYRQELDYSANESYKSLRTNLLFCGEDKKVMPSCRVPLSLPRSLRQLPAHFLYR